MLVDRIIAAARLDPRLYEAVEADPPATPQVVVVVLVSLSTGIGAVGLGGGVGSLIVGVIGGIVFWAL